MPADPQKVEMLRNLHVPQQMPNSRKLVDYLLTHSEADTSLESPDEAIEHQNELIALMVRSHLDVINVLGQFDETLRSFKNIIGQEL